MTIRESAPLLFISALTLLMLSTTPTVLAASSQLSCRHIEGERLFDSDVKVERSGAWVTITTASRAPDGWTYKIMYEHPATGYRAIRAGRDSSTAGSLDVEYGGELFLFIQNSERRLLVTAVHAARNKVSSEMLSCRDAP